MGACLKILCQALYIHWVVKPVCRLVWYLFVRR